MTIPKINDSFFRWDVYYVLNRCRAEAQPIRRTSNTNRLPLGVTTWASQARPVGGRESAQAGTNSQGHDRCGSNRTKLKGVPGQQDSVIWLFWCIVFMWHISTADPTRSLDWMLGYGNGSFLVGLFASRVTSHLHDSSSSISFLPVLLWIIGCCFGFIRFQAMASIGSPA